MTRLVRFFIASVRPLFSLREDTDYEGTIRQVRSDAELHSGNIWALVFAILIASVGLNVNSTAVIIGAMLISPLMGPIVGAGFALATNDFPLLRRSARNLMIATIVALIASTLYFSISPLAEAQSELLARTRPTLYDVLIALFGGGAGAVAGSRKSKMVNAVPGVAIATALMPPLCTAGFGLASGQYMYFVGALHLFLINALFICLSTLGFVRLMHFERIQEVQSQHLVRTRWVIIFVTLCIAVPSIYTGYIVVQEARFKQAAQRFAAENLRGFNGRTVVNLDYQFVGKKKTISATIIGKPLPDETIATLKQRLPSYGLMGTQLELSQMAEDQASVEQVGMTVRQGIIEDLYKRNEAAIGERDARIRLLEKEVVRLSSEEFPVSEVVRDCGVLFPTLVSLLVGHEVRVAESAPGDAATASKPAEQDGQPAAKPDAESEAASGVVVLATWSKVPSKGELTRMQEYLAVRFDVASVRLVNASL